MKAVREISEIEGKMKVIDEEKAEETKTEKAEK